MMTDVMALKQEGLSVSCANFSCGYHRPHSASEYVCISEVEACLDLFLSICEQLTEVYGHQYEAPVYKAPTYPTYGSSWKDYKPSTSAYAYSSIKESYAGFCDNCMQYHKSVEFSYMWSAYLCTNCEVQLKF